MLLQSKDYPNLPKWPASFITGSNVTVEQAKEIIFRTDTSVVRPSTYAFGGNDKSFQSRCSTRFGWDKLEKLHTEYDAARELALKNFSDTEPLGHIPKCPWYLHDKWSEQMGMLDTEYVYNSFLSTAYAGGPTGWCQPSGKILFENHNFGKYPSVEEIVQDWEKLATAFPYIDLVNTLYSGENGEEHKSPVCTIIVKNGVVEVHTPDLALHMHEPMMGFNVHVANLLNCINGNYSSERSWPHEWVEEFAVKSNTVLNALLKEHDTK